MNLLNTSTLLFLIIWIIVNMSISVFLYGDYVQIKKIYILDDTIQFLKFDNVLDNFEYNNYVPYEHYLTNTDTITDTVTDNKKRYNLRTYQKKFYATLDNKKTCHFDIQNLLMIQNYIDQMEKHDTKYYTTVQIDNPIKNTYVCSKPETYIELYLNFLFAKLIIVVISCGLLFIFLTMFYELKSYIEPFCFSENYGHIKTTISEENNEEVTI